MQCAVCVRRLRIFNLPVSAYEASTVQTSAAATAPAITTWANEAELESALYVQEGERIYDYCWSARRAELTPRRECLL